MKRKIAAVTEGRMTYGLLYWTLKELEKHPSFELHLIATGSHLSRKHGLTIQEIKTEGFANLHHLNSIDEDAEQSKAGIAKSMARIISGLADIFAQIQPDLMIILGDRHELLAAASVATVMNIPIAHICGGEISEGALDEQVRHALTKLSHLHFTGCEKYQRNVINLGENPRHVFNVGEPAVENIKRMPLMDKQQLFRQLSITDENKPLFLITYHPTTLEDDGERKIDNFIAALGKYDALQIITAPNQDHLGDLFFKKLKAYADNNHNDRNNSIYFFSSLGFQRYLSAMNACNLVLGNSSSGIIETPSFKVPTVNVGNRQRGRLRSANIIDCDDDQLSIVLAIKQALSENFKKSLSDLSSPFGQGETSRKIIQELEKIADYGQLLNKSLQWKKEQHRGNSLQSGKNEAA